MTGLSTEQFGKLHPYFAETHDAYFTNYDMNGNYRNNRRRFIICKNSRLPAVEDRLFFLPGYLKNRPLQEYHAAGFNMVRKHCNGFIHVLYPVPDQCLHDAGVMPADSQKKFAEISGSLPEENESLPVLLHHGTEREIPRPLDCE